MAFEAKSLDDYIDVAERIRMFHEQYPTGSLQPANPANPYDVVTIGEKTFIVYIAAAYRTPDDPCPGIGAAWEPFPGLTPYTRNSELMVAETSAWGRAIVASLTAGTKKIASREEVQNRTPAATQPQRPSEPSQRPPEASHPSDAPMATEAQIRAIRAISKSMGRTPPIGYEQATKREAMAIIDELKNAQAAEATSDEEPF